MSEMEQLHKVDTYLACEKWARKYGNLFGFMMIYT